MPKKSPAPTAALAVIDDSKPIDLAKLDGAQISNSWKFDADQLGERAKAMLAHVDALKTERAQKGILAGLYLHQVKLSLGHGSFGEWKKKHFPKGHSMIGYYMSLAEKFARSAKLYMPELVASQQLSLELEAPKGTAQQFKNKLVKFVGASGLTDLMQRHGVIKRGGKKTPKKGDDKGGSAGGDTPASLTPEAQAVQDCVDAIKAASDVLLNDVLWSLLTPESAGRVDPLLAKLASDFHARLLRARHEAK